MPERLKVAYFGRAIYERWISRYEQGRLEALSNLKAALEEEAILAEQESETGRPLARS